MRIFHPIEVHPSNNKGGIQLDEKTQYIYDRIDGFKDKRVWVTKKIRMGSEERMNSHNIYSIFIINYYTFLVLILSVLGVIFNKDFSLTVSIFSVIVSIALFGISLYITLYGYRERALKYKQSYMELSSIEANAENLLMKVKFNLVSLDIAITEFGKLKSDYNHILDKTENHSTFDRLVYLKNREKLNRAGLWAAYYFKYIVPTLIFKIFLVTLPFILILLWWLMEG